MPIASPLAIPSMLKYSLFVHQTCTVNYPYKEIDTK